MFTKNLVILTGFVGQEPKITNFENGGKSALISLATSRTYKNKEGEKVEETDWHTVVVNGNRADVVEKYIKKGTYLSVDGRLKTRNYDDANGNKKYVTEVIAENIQFHNDRTEPTGE